MELIAIGTIRTAWGLKGWLKLASFSGEWDHFVDLESVELMAPGKSATREYRVEDFRMHQSSGMFKLAGVESPEAGKALAGSEILVPRDHAASLNEDEWYLSDLVGLSLKDVNGEVLGEIVGIIESSDDLLEISRGDGSRFMVPFRRNFVGEPNLQSRSIILTAAWLAEES